MSSGVNDIDVTTEHVVVCRGGKRDGMRLKMPDYINELIVYPAENDPGGTYHRTDDREGLMPVLRWAEGDFSCPCHSP